MMLSVILAAAAAAEQGASFTFDWFGFLRAFLSCVSILAGLFFVLAGTLGCFKIA